MQQYDVGELIDGALLVTYGRTYYDEHSQTLHFNWTNSGFELLFRGTRLTAGFCAEYGEEVEGLPWDETAPRRKTWPWLSVFLDGRDTPAHVFEVSSDQEQHLIFESETPETHRIRIVKRTENGKTFAGLNSLLAEGKLLPVARADRKQIEFVGDSITCGFGNGTPERDRGFYSAEEDGWLSYGARTARLLGMDCSCVCISGISACGHKGSFMPYSMDELYRYADKPHQLKSGRQNPPTDWSFQNHPSDYIVLNLGTNDAYAILFGQEENGEAVFEENYIAFLREIRQLNGLEAHLVCTLGSMNYFLWHNIVHAVERYQSETGDGRIRCYKFQLIHPFDGYGAAGHPSMATHEKMAAEIAGCIRQLEEEQA